MVKGLGMDYKIKIIKKFIAYLMEMIPPDNQDETKMKTVDDIKNHLTSLKVEGKLDFSYEESSHIVSDSLTGYNIMVSHSYLVVRDGGEKLEEYFANIEGDISTLSINHSDGRCIKYMLS